MKNFEDKLLVMKNKSKLRSLEPDRKIFINSDMTRNEWEIQAHIREEAKKLDRSKRKEEGLRMGKKEATTAKEKEKKRDKILWGTWNVRGTFAAGAMKELLSEFKRYNLDIIALQETKQMGSGIEETKDGIFCKSGGKDRKLGTGFIIKITLNTRC
ncbi:hypothetical protein HHI36_004503 [Cryptolaemus montrouzieri]|uniref:Endonuclease/exonuclease/phosphatase domain-containing protein n=1 Tax=Cryptolaemus montrouzieri TaxID=559131 RepID=A0ABD2NRN7_9CUCU